MPNSLDDGLLATLLVTELSQLALEYLNKRKQPGASEADAEVTVEPITTVEV